MLDVKRNRIGGRATLLAGVLAAVLPALCRADVAVPGGYREPPPPITRAFDRAPPPIAVIDPRHRFVLVAQPHAMPAIDQLAAGVGADGLRRFRYRSLRLVDLGAGRDVELAPALPARLGYPRWAPDGKHFLFAALSSDGPGLWLGSATGDVRRIAIPGLRDGRGHACRWMPDGDRLICLLDVQTGTARDRPRFAPRVRDTVATRAPGTPAPAQTRHRRRGATAISRLALVELPAGRVTPLGAPAPVARVRPSPDGRYLLVWTGETPGREPRIEVWRAQPDASPVLSMSPRGRRLARWQGTAPATLVWVEPRDGPAADNGDRVMSRSAPFDAAPRERFRAGSRITDLKWTASSGRMLVTEYRAVTGERRNWLAAPDAAAPGRLLWAEQVDSVYDDPGLPLRERPGADPVVAEHEGEIWLAGHGATPAGSRPFLDRVDLASGEVRRLWRSDAGHHERIEALASTDASLVLASRESPSRPRSFHLLRPGDGERRAVTEEAAGNGETTWTTRVLHYARADGTRLSATLHLPAGHEPGTRLALVMEAYPRNYAQAASTGEMRVALNRHPVLRSFSALPLVMHGYAVLRNVAMPVTGAPDEANDTFIEQVGGNARAAIDAAVATGDVDPQRVGVVGHSYGAFMVATLLAHSDLFRAGVAASGAYNRTLTPFGFQTEPRTLWQAPQTYLRLSPFLVADRIDTPLLLLHRERDDNPGTSPMQSQQLFDALQANGGTARLVMLPYEGHVYRARESVLHATAEMIDWFDEHLRARPADPPPAALRVAAGRTSR